MNGPPTTPSRNTLALIGVLLCVGGGLILWRFEPTGQSWYPKCAFHTWTGFHCPGCGTTRALHSLAHGRLLDAIRFNSLLIIGGPIMALLIFRARRREKTTGVAAARLSWTLFIVVTLYFIGRNVPSPTQSWLAPPPQAELPDASL